MVLALLAVLALVTAAAAADESPAARLIEYGWDVPSAEFVRDHIRQMEARPFDGVILRLPEHNHAFDPRPWSEADLETQFAILDAITWERFTDNFLILYAANPWGMDWADDAQWAAIEDNLRLVARAAQRGRCAGVCFDAEPYGPNPWVWEGPFDAAGFAARAAQVRRRGSQFMAALQSADPEFRLMTFFLLSYQLGAAAEPDPALRSSRLASTGYALLPAFVDGMLDAAGPGVALIDGNEGAYYYTRPDQYRQGIDEIRHRVLSLVAAENRAAYRDHVEPGMAIYADQLLGRRHPAGGFLSHYLDPAQQLRWVEHNVYWALRTADRYAWFYSERLDWWRDETPVGLDEAVRAGRARAAAGGELEFELAPVLRQAESAMQAAFEARCVRRAAAVPYLYLPPPQIDGELDDPAWQAVRPLEPFLARAFTGSEQAGVPTEARVAYDGDALYVALRCAEPEPGELRSAGSRRDDALWNGDTVELFLSQGADAAPYFHLIVNPGNARWDGDSSLEGDNAAWDAAWQSATAVGPNAWTVELAIPWSSVGGRPAAGSARRANLCRQRVSSGEISSWSTVVQGFLEPQRFGIWEFAE
ncbi:MAG: sugar-binding protein [Gemmatimonadota bacterium]